MFDEIFNFINCNENNPNNIRIIPLASFQYSPIDDTIDEPIKPAIAPTIAMEIIEPIENVIMKKFLAFLLELAEKLLTYPTIEAIIA